MFFHTFDSRSNLNQLSSQKDFLPVLLQLRQVLTKSMGVGIVS